MPYKFMTGVLEHHANACIQLELLPLSVLKTQDKMTRIFSGGFLAM